MSQHERSLTQAIIDTVRDPMLVLGPDLRVQSANAFFSRAFQVGAPGPEGRLLAEVGNGVWDIPALRPLLEAVLVTDRALDDYEMEDDFPGAGHRTMLLNARKIAGFDLILVAMEDITTRKETELALRRAKEQAEKTVNTVREPMLVLDEGLRVRTVNDAFYTVFGADPDVRGRLVYELGNGEWDIPRLRELLENVLPHDNVLIDYRVDHEFREIGRRQMLLNARRLDHVQLILLSIEDVTERERVEEELRRANQFKDELLGMVSHEFRTPLTTISGNIDLLARRWNDLPSEARRQALADLRSHSDRLERLIQNMLLVARGGTGAQLDVEPLLLQRVLPPIISAERERDTSRPVTLVVDAHLPPVLCNVGILEQVIENVLANSRTFGRGGTVIEVSVDRHNGQAVLTVRDQGDELDASRVAHFFEPFYREASHERGISGAGLGLTVSARLVQLIKGTITARPRAGGGLEVELTVPLAEDNDDSR